MDNIFVLYKHVTQKSFGRILTCLLSTDEQTNRYPRRGFFKFYDKYGKKQCQYVFWINAHLENMCITIKYVQSVQAVCKSNIVCSPWIDFIYQIGKYLFFNM